jgi:hypothetical protein
MIAAIRSLLLPLLWTGFSSDVPILSVQQVPLTAATPVAFVPAGWHLEHRSVGDLNGDQRPDQALVLLAPTPSLTSQGLRPDRPRVLLVLLAQPKGGWRRVALAQRLLRCPDCFGSLGPGMPDVTITHGLLEVEHEYGITYYCTQLQRLRYEPTTGRLRLIGEECHSADRVGTALVAVSTNLLTGQQTIEQTTKRAEGPGIKHHRAVKVPKIYAEDLASDGDSPSWWPAEFEG